MSSLLQPVPLPSPTAARTGIVALLAASAACIFSAPLFMPVGYSWLSHAISESAAQGLHLAWIARLGFVLFGLAVLWLALYRRASWARGTWWMQLVFAVCMLATAAFSHKPWLAGVATDGGEDFLHSLTATGMGFAFTLGVIARLLQRGAGEGRTRIFDVTAIVAASVLTPIGGWVPDIAGLLQRLMFAVAYLWFAHEAFVPRTDPPRA